MANHTVLHDDISYLLGNGALFHRQNDTVFGLNSNDGASTPHRLRASLKTRKLLERI